MDLSPGQRAALDEITAQLAAAAGPALPGTLTVRAYACGKARCRCHADPPRLHGPYAEWTRKIGGKTITRRLTDAQLADWQPLFDTAKRLRALLADLQDLTLDIVEASQGQEPHPGQTGQNPVGTARLTCDQPAHQSPSAQLNAKGEDLTRTGRDLPVLLLHKGSKETIPKMSASNHRPIASACKSRNPDSMISRGLPTERETTAVPQAPRAPSEATGRGAVRR